MEARWAIQPGRRCHQRARSLSGGGEASGPWRSFGPISGVVSPREARRSGGRILPAFGGALLRDQQVQRGTAETAWSAFVGSLHLLSGVHRSRPRSALASNDGSKYRLSSWSVKRRAWATRGGATVRARDRRATLRIVALEASEWARGTANREAARNLQHPARFAARWLLPGDHPRIVLSSLKRPSSGKVSLTESFTRALISTASDATAAAGSTSQDRSPQSTRTMTSPAVATAIVK